MTEIDWLLRSQMPNKANEDVQLDECMATLSLAGGESVFGKEQNVTINDTKDVTKELTERQKLIIELIKNNALVTIPEMSQKTGVVIRTIKRDIEDLQSKGVLTREGGRKSGRWIIKQLTK